MPRPESSWWSNFAINHKAAQNKPRGPDGRIIESTDRDPPRDAQRRRGRTRRAIEALEEQLARRRDEEDGW